MTNRYLTNQASRQIGWHTGYGDPIFIELKNREDLENGSFYFEIKNIVTGCVACGILTRNEKGSRI